MLQARPVIHVVDAEGNSRNSVADLLSGVGYAVLLYDDAESFLKCLNPHREAPQCILLDVVLPGMSGLGLQRRLSAMNDSTPIIFVSRRVDIGTVAAAFRSGAHNFLEKPVHRHLVMRCIQEALDRDSTVISHRLRKQRWQERLTRLTRREQDVFDLLVSGESTKEIAQTLNVGLQTVAKHRARVLQKLEVRSVVELVRRLVAMCPASLDVADRRFSRDL